MKRILNILICTAVTVLAISCNRYEIEMPVDYNDRIEINFSSADTKAADTDTESYLDHVDILIFKHDGTVPTDKMHYERITLGGTTNAVLAAKRSSFVASVGYYVQVIANSTASEDVFKAIETYQQLTNLEQEDVYLHITGLNAGDAPKYFLMDGVAYIGAEKPSAPSPVVMNDGIASNNTNLNVNLARAAAKIEVIINAGKDVEFKSGLVISEGQVGLPLYQVRNLPYSTYVIDTDPGKNTKLITTSSTSSGYMIWNPVITENTTPDPTSIIVYAYAHSWQGASIFEKEPCIVVNLPLEYTDDSDKVTQYPNNWYKIPMSADYKFDRNMYYKVEITVNRPGATSMSNPKELGPINYTVKDWTPVEISINDAKHPKYLAVNRNSMEMYNVVTDNTTLEFSSSSAVTVEVSDVYYIDKFGATVKVTNHDIEATADGLSGNVVIDSPLPTNNTVLYFTLTLTNDDNQTEIVTVKQYPLVYVENILSYYSYRDDFIGEGASEPTTYENLSRTNNIVGISYTNGKYTYNTSSGGFFYSKIVRNTYSSTDNRADYRGRSDIDGYYWYDNEKSYTNSENPSNARMYHITIMASSGDYVVGRPKITNGITDNGEDNAQLVSPSFMIASRLAVLTVNSIDLEADWNDSDEVRNAEYLEIYAEHCKQYVEVYKDPSGNEVHLNDWRLPTAAELSIIYSLQGTASQSADAIDYLLNAGYYFSASGPIRNDKADNDYRSLSSIRCVRDTY